MGSGSCTTKWRASEKIELRTRNVVGASKLRWKLLARFATVRWTRPSGVSHEGATVAAFAVHMAEALDASRKKYPSSVRAACAITSASLPEKPRRRRATT